MMSCVLLRDSRCRVVTRIIVSKNELPKAVNKEHLLTLGNSMVKGNIGTAHRSSPRNAMRFMEKMSNKYFIAGAMS